uniref:Uncharacterized protein LOC111109409 isoform X2 n=1 Tax=Crassostrea virginica TaxID=6565 RepID=A0A8B8BCR5_CRAVI|nr:uncharacterized protein LOC111109409 isoform X2 [Crassostrea virginica]
MAFLFIFPSVFCLTFTALTKGQENQQFKTLFENPLDNFPLQNIEFDPQTNNYFVSGKNVLYKFNEDTKIPRLDKKTGPEANCLEGLSEKDNRAYCGDDYNSVMVVTTDSLITCSTLKGGLCVRRNKENLDPETSSGNIRLVSDESRAVGIFINLNVSNSGGQQNIVLFAKQCTRLPLSTLKRSVIFSVSPTLSTKSPGDFGEIFDLFLSNPEAQKMDYRVVMENENFVFLLVNQNSQSRLVKICKNIDSSSSKKVYEDIPIWCNSNGTNLTHVEHGASVSILGRQCLVVLFSNLSTGRSAVCVFDENEIYEAFLKSRRHRFGCPKHDLSAKDVIFMNEINYFNQALCVMLPFNKSDEILYDPEEKITMEVREIKVDGSEIRAIKTINGATYIMSQTKIIKMLQMKNCSQYPDNCALCLDVRTSNCELGVADGGFITQEFGVCLLRCFENYTATGR